MKVELNKNKDVVKVIQEGLIKTGGYCPCRLMHTPENICICKEFQEQIKDPDFQGYCYCKLFYKEK